ncbi:hypothetical protein E2562_036811 [Oryza meyeriana var. granulata]|uniref:DUF834 domain-containing protein n=1 Tax=Oryza meyeriana var. granulata TaxID=110450 RepID=A0A6G1ETE1_9ORYZ|nr:hypothetical protein E2562_036811 [Oryza meyeriana var. granulata]
MERRSELALVPASRGSRWVAVVAVAQGRKRGFRRMQDWRGTCVGAWDGREGRGREKCVPDWGIGGERPETTTVQSCAVEIGEGWARVVVIDMGDGGGDLLKRKR